MDVAIQHYVRTNILRSDACERVNSFTIRFDPLSALRFLNHAVPDDGTDPDAAAIDELIDAFRARNRMPRLEYLPSLSPALAAGLAAAEFTVESRMPLMACPAGRSAPVPPPDGVTLTVPHTMDQYLDAVTIQYLAFDEPGVPTEADARSLVADPVARGGTAVIAVDDGGTVLGTGQCGASVDGVTELAGVAVHPDHQGRGIGTELVARLTGDAHAAGVSTVWLDPSGPAAQRLYERAGYRTVGEVLHMALDTTV